MIQAFGKLVTFDEFVTKYPDIFGKRYELYDGAIIAMPPPTGDYEEVVGFWR